MKHVVVILALSVIPSLCAQDSSPAPRRESPAGNPQTTYDPNLHLLVDPDSIVESDGITVFVNQPEKHPEPVIVSTWKPYRMALVCGTVFREPDGLFRIWYLDTALNTHDQTDRKVFGEGTDYGYYPKAAGDYREVEQSVICYAESWDGVRWNKPELGLFEFQGSAKNNIVCAGHKIAEKTDHALTNMCGFSVLRDDQEPDPQKRYKLIGYWETFHKYDNGVSKLNRPAEDIKRFRKAAGHYVCYSPDGIHFGDLEPSGQLHTHKDSNNVIYDHKRKQWRSFLRPDIPPTEHSAFIRAVALSTSSDLKNWSDLETIIVPDEQDGFGGIQQPYLFVPLNYGSDDIGLLPIMNFRGRHSEIFLACLQKNGKWIRLFRDTPLIPTGPAGAFDRARVIPAFNEPILVGNEMFIYYTGISGKDSHPAGSRSIGLAKFRRDAFIGIAAGVIAPKSNFDTSGEATFTTRPLPVSAANLAVNFEKLEDSASFRLELLDENKSPIPGFTLDDCLPVTLDNIRAPIEWKTNKDLSSLLGKEVSLRVSFIHGAVYAFQFYDPKKND